jgi:hypothetical protein
MDQIQQALEATEALLRVAKDPAIQDVYLALTNMRDGKEPGPNIGRIVTANYVPAPTAEIEAWADLVLNVWHESKRG